MKIDEAVEILAMDRVASYPLQREFAVAAFSAWLNWPSEENATTAFLLIAVNRGVLHFEKKGLHVPTEWLNQVYEPRNVITSVVSGLSSPFFEELDFNPVYNDYRYTADIVRFLLTFKTSSNDKRKQASLGKAAIFLNKHGGFVAGRYGRETNDWCAMTGHQSIWRKYKKSAALQFVRFYGTKLEWLLRPHDVDFLERLTALAARRQEIIDFFAKTLDIQDRLRAILDERSLGSNDHLTLPPTLKKLTCRTPAMPASAYSKMTEYKRSWALQTPKWD